MTERRDKLETVAFGVRDAYDNMALDLRLFDRCEDGAAPGFLRFYTWSQRALSLGFFENIGAIDRAKAVEDGVQVVRRPTGGRVVLHGDDLTYMVVTRLEPDRRPHDGFRIVSECIARGLRSLGADVALDRGRQGKSHVKHKPCFVSASRHEITYQGRKVVGSAQKIGNAAVLQHGSIPLGQGYLKVVEYMKCSDRERRSLLSEMGASTCCLYDLLASEPPASEIARVLAEAFGERFDLDTRPTKPLDTNSLAFI